MLKHTNRIWFANELSQYLDKLRGAKDSFISRIVPPVRDIYREGDEEEIAIMFEDTEDCESITLNQIAHQYTEIENIHKTVLEVPVSLSDV